jgi:hypothetical protein
MLEDAFINAVPLERRARHDGQGIFPTAIARTSWPLRFSIVRAL